MSRRLACLTSVTFLVLGTVARADIDVEVGNADTITGTISPATETEVIRFRVPANASVSIKAKAAKKGPELHLRLRDPMGADVRTADGKAAAIAGAVAAVSGTYSVEVTSRNGIAVGDYSISVSWKGVPSATVTANLATGVSSSLMFSADAGATTTLSVKPGKGSKAVGALDSLTAPGPSVDILSGASAKRTLEAGGDFVLTFKNAGATTGDVTATVKVKPPKPSKKKIALTSKVIGPGGAKSDYALAGVLGTAGGTVLVPVIASGQPGSEIAGASVTVPSGALGAPTTIVVATAPAIAAPAGGQGAGPTVFFGPEGTQFDKVDKTKKATITLPYDGAFDATTDSLQIYTRDAKGKVTVVPPPYTFNKTAHTVTFPTSHFSSFRAVGPGTGAQTVILTYANSTDPRDVCIAYEPTSPSLPAIYFVAEGQAKTVAALRLNLTATTLDRETWIGGGTQSADGTPRLQFKFTAPVLSVTSALDGNTWAATSTQIFHVGTDENVRLYAGTGAASDTGDNGAATSATFVSIAAILVDDDDGTLYVADSGAHRIRRIDAATQKIFAWAGSGLAGIGPEGDPLDVTTFVGPLDITLVPSPGRGLYVADGARVRQLAPEIIPVAPLINVTVAGSAAGATGSGGDGGPVLEATFRQISGLTTIVDIADQNALKLAVTDSTDQTLRMIDLTNDKVTLLAGQHGVAGFSGDFSAFPGLMDGPRGIVSTPAQVTYAETNNGKIRTRFIGPGFP